MAKKQKTLQSDKKLDNFVYKCVLSGNISYIIIFIVVVILIIGSIILYKKFYKVKVELDSCRSSCRS
jgi:cell division protein FtsL